MPDRVASWIDDGDRLDFDQRIVMGEGVHLDHGGGGQVVLRKIFQPHIVNFPEMVHVLYEGQFFTGIINY